MIKLIYRRRKGLKVFLKVFFFGFMNPEGKEPMMAGIWQLAASKIKEKLRAQALSHKHNIENTLKMT